jgi:hypothetical protein
MALQRPGAPGFGRLTPARDAWRPPWWPLAVLAALVAVVLVLLALTVG